jgi:hypothetical protein
MPQTNTYKNIAPRTRKGTIRRTHRTGHGCTQRNRKDPAPSCIIADSISALKLQPIPGIFIAQKIEEGINEHDDYEKMYHDLFGAYYRYCELSKIECSRFDPLASGLDMGKSMFVITQRMKDIIPKGCELNIDRDGDDGDYFFSIFKEVDFGSYWHFFNIGPVVQWLEKKDKNLLKAFIAIISALLQYCDFDIWFSGNLYAFDMVLMDEAYGYDFVYNSSDDDEERIRLFDVYNKTKERYSRGDIYQYAEKINHNHLSLQWVEKTLMGYRKKTPLINWLLQAKDFINDRLCLRHFIYNPGFEENEVDGCLKLNDQITILWSDNDMIFQITSEYMDNEAANFGIQIPIFNIPVAKNSRFIVTDKLPIAEKWFRKIDDLFQGYQDILKYIKYECKN